MELMSLSKEAISKVFKEGQVTVCVIGLGRVGLPTAAVFAEAGARVIGADIDNEVVELINSGKCRFNDEPGLNALVERMVKNGNLTATIDVVSAVERADVIIVCVPTPVDESKVPDYSAVRRACQDIAKTLRKGCLVIVESTVGPGTVEDLVVPLLERETKMKAGVDFNVASCPERADPGRILQNSSRQPSILLRAIK